MKLQNTGSGLHSSLYLWVDETQKYGFRTPFIFIYLGVDETPKYGFRAPFNFIGHLNQTDIQDLQVLRQRWFKVFLLDYLILGCTAIGVSKSEFVTKTPFLCHLRLHWFNFFRRKLIFKVILYACSIHLALTNYNKLNSMLVNRLVI